MPDATPKLALPFPVAADTHDVPTDMEALAVDLDDLVGLSSWKTISQISGQFSTDAAANTWFLRYGAMATVSASYGMPLAWLDADDYAIPGRTTQLRVHGVFAANATAPGINFTFGLYPMTVAGAADDFAATKGTVVAGTTVLLTAPSASTAAVIASSPITFNAANVPDGAYAVGFVTSGQLANNSYCQIATEIQIRHIA